MAIVASERLLTAAELARLLGLKRQTVLTLAKAGKIPSLRLTNKIVRFDPAAVLAAMGRTAGDRA